MTFSTLIFLLACQRAGDPGPSSPAATVTPPAVDEAAPKPAAAPEASFRTVTVAEFAAVEPRPTVLDVRTQGEFDSGHVPGAIHIPVDQVADRLSELEDHRGADLYVICASGGRSATASGTLAAQGFQAVNVDGGTKGWIAAGHPVE